MPNSFPVSNDFGFQKVPFYKTLNKQTKKSKSIIKHI